MNNDVDDKFVQVNEVKVTVFTKTETLNMIFVTGCFNCSN